MEADVQADAGEENICVRPSSSTGGLTTLVLTICYIAASDSVSFGGICLVRKVYESVMKNKEAFSVGGSRDGVVAAVVCLARDPRMTCEGASANGLSA